MRRCMVCKREIETDRAVGMPKTRLCTEHGAEIEKYGGEFLIRAGFDRTSKPGSLKHNYGGVTTTLTRNDEGLNRLKDDYELQQMDGNY